MFTAQEKEDIFAVSLASGYAAGLLVFIVGELPSNLPNLMAIVQASIVGIAVAIYVLSNQLTAENYSVRILAILDSETGFDNILRLFGFSIIVDILIIISHPVIKQNRVSSAISALLLTMLFAGSLSSVYISRHKIIRQSLPSNIAERTKNALSKDYIINEIRTNNRPFFQLFEGIRASIREGDQQAALELTQAACESISDGLSHLQEFGTESENLSTFANIVANTLNSANKEGQFSLSIHLHSWALTECVNSIERNYNGFAHQLLPTLNSSIRTLSAELGVGSLRQIDWNKYEEIFTTAVELKDKESLLILTESVASFAQDFEEARGSDDSDLDRSVLKRLIEAFFAGWIHLVETGGELPDSDELYQADPDYMQPMVPMEFQFNEFLDKFSTIAFAISLVSRDARGQLDLHSIGYSISDELLELSSKIYNRDRRELSILVVKMGIICSYRIGTSPMVEKLANDIGGRYSSKPELDAVIYPALNQLSYDDPNELYSNNGLLMDIIGMLLVPGDADTEEVVQEFSSFIAELEQKVDTLV